MFSILGFVLARSCYSCIVRLRVAVYRAKAAYNHRTFPLTICWFVSVSPVHCGKMADWIWIRFGMVGRMGPRMRQVVGLEIGPGEGVFF